MERRCTGYVIEEVYRLSEGGEVYKLGDRKEVYKQDLVMERRCISKTM